MFSDCNYYDVIIDITMTCAAKERRKCILGQLQVANQYVIIYTFHVVGKNIKEKGKNKNNSF